METKRKWYQKTGVIIVLLILFFPVGLYLMWKHASWNKMTKWIVTGVFAFLVISGAFSPKTTKTSDTTPKNATATTSPTIGVNTQPETTTKQEKEVEPTKAPEQGETVSQKNAVRKAESYLSFSGFSRDGLVTQLEYEKFSHEDAVYGADNSGANWNEEAAQKAKSYMDMTGYSREGLIQQLLYEKFTRAQAEYGVNAVGL